MSERKITPVALHIIDTESEDYESYLCGVRRRSWREVCLSDEFARELPKCKECIDEAMRGEEE